MEKWTFLHCCLRNGMLAWCHFAREIRERAKAEAIEAVIIPIRITGRRDMKISVASTFTG